MERLTRRPDPLSVRPEVYCRGSPTSGRRPATARRPTLVVRVLRGLIWCIIGPLLSIAVHVGSDLYLRTADASGNESGVKQKPIHERNHARRQIAPLCRQSAVSGRCRPGCGRGSTCAPRHYSATRRSHRQVERRAKGRKQADSGSRRIGAGNVRLREENNEECYWCPEEDSNLHSVATART